MLRDRRFWHSLIAAVMVAIFIGILDFVPRYSSPEARLYLFPFFLSLIFIFGIFEKDWKTAFATCFVTYLLASVIVAPLGAWLLLRTGNLGFALWLSQITQEVRSMDTKQGATIATAWVVISYFLATLILRHDERQAARQQPVR